MKGSWHLGTIGGVRVGVHYSWFAVFLLVAWTLAIGLFPQQYPGLGSTTYWIMGFLSSLLLFVSVLVHELAHSFVAIARGLSVKGITLFIFGGVASINDEAESARDEFVISAVGPASSLLLAAAFWIAGRAMAGGPAPVEGVLSYLAGINVLLALFNLIPGFPLDGGRVLRAILWGVTGSMATATRIAIGVGRVIAFLFIFGGMFLALSGSFITGVWLLFIGWFLNNAAESSGLETEQRERLKGVTVADVMNPHPITVAPSTRLSELVHDYILQRGLRALPVVEDGELTGMLTLHGVRSVPREQWDTTPVRFAMTGLNELQVTTPSAPLTSALRTLSEHDINQMPVVSGGRLVGLVSRSNVIRFLQVREELGMDGREETRRAA